MLCIPPTGTQSNAPLQKHSFIYGNMTAIDWTPVVCFAFLLLALKQSCVLCNHYILYTPI